MYNKIIEIDSFYIGRDEIGWGHYPKVKLVNGDTFYLKSRAKIYYCDFIKSNEFDFILTKNRNLVLHDTSDEHVDNFLKRLIEKALISQWVPNSNFKIKGQTLDSITEFSDLIKYLKTIDSIKIQEVKINWE